VEWLTVAGGRAVAVLWRVAVRRVAGTELGLGWA